MRGVLILLGIIIIASVTTLSSIMLVKNLTENNDSKKW